MKPLNGIRRSYYKEPNRKCKSNRHKKSEMKVLDNKVRKMKIMEKNRVKIRIKSNEIDLRSEKSVVLLLLFEIRSYALIKIGIFIYWILKSYLFFSYS